MKNHAIRNLVILLVVLVFLVIASIAVNMILSRSLEARYGQTSAEGAAQPAQTGTGQISYGDFNNTSPGPSVTMDPNADPYAREEEEDGGEEEASEPVDLTVGGGEHRYEVIADDCGWTEAQQKCEARGGHLAVIDTEEELDEIISLTEAAGLDRVWIGLRRVNGRECWVGKDEFYEGFRRWGRGEPSYRDVNDDVAEDYVMLWNLRGWAYNDNRDDPCHDYPADYSGHMGYVCEFGG